MINGNDIKLIQESASGDMGSFEKLVRGYYPMLRRIVACRIGKSFDRDDVLQEILLIAWMNIGKLKKAGSFRFWIVSIANNCCKKWYRSKTREEPFDHEMIETLSDRNAGWCVSTDTGPDISEEIDKLPEAQRMVILDFYFKDLKIREISETRNIPEGTVKRRLHDGRKKLRQRLEGDNE